MSESAWSSVGMVGEVGLILEVSSAASDPAYLLPASRLASYQLWLPPKASRVWGSNADRRSWLGSMGFTLLISASILGFLSFSSGSK